MEIYRGSGLLSRLVNYFPERFLKLAFLDVGYVAPSDDTFDLDAFNETMEKTIGYPAFAYWNFFTAPDAAELMDRNVSDECSTDPSFWHW